MPETKILDVTPEDISNGRRQSNHGCPFALAARRLFGTDAISVIPTRIRVGTYPSDERWTLDEAGTAAIDHYDSTGEMLPGQYTLTFDDDDD